MDNSLNEYQDKLDIEARVKNLPAVTDFIGKSISCLKISQMELAQVLIVAEELFVNIASYAYKPGIGRACLLTRVSRQENSVEITFIDSGVKYNPLEREDPDITLDATKRKQGGLGVFFVKKKMDKMTYSYEDGKNILTVKKFFKGNADGD
jgi:anti-sigma regulatory factor (Ser/Thr protein kinase)